MTICKAAGFPDIARTYIVHDDRISEISAIDARSFTSCLARLLQQHSAKTLALSSTILVLVL